MGNRPAGPEELKAALEAHLGETILAMDMAEFNCVFEPFKRGDWGFLMITKNRLCFRAFEKVSTLEQFVRPRDGDPLAWSAMIEIRRERIQASVAQKHKGFLDRLFKAPEPIDIRIAPGSPCLVRINDKGGVEEREEIVGAEGTTIRAHPLARGKEILEALLALE